MCLAILIKKNQLTQWYDKVFAKNRYLRLNETQLKPDNIFLLLGSINQVKQIEESKEIKH